MILSTNNLFKKVKTLGRVEITGDLLLQLQGVLLEMLSDFSAVCEKYGFYYSLCGGTALGAVRHRGFIPWDDDVDVFMHRKDLDEFYKVYEKELADKYDLHSCEVTPELGIPIIRLLKKGTTLVLHDTLDSKEKGVFIDICLLENAPDNRILRTLHGIGSLYYGFCVSCVRFYYKRDLYRKQFVDADEYVKSEIEKKIKIGRLFSWRTLDKWTLKYSKWNALCKNNESEYVVCPTGMKHYFGELFPRNIYMKTTPVLFENKTFQIIKEYDWALTRLYGDYMQIPPEDKRESHFVIDIKL